MVHIANADYDYALDCNDCGRIFIFADAKQRADELRLRHQDHETDLFMMGRV